MLVSSSSPKVPETVKAFVKTSLMVQWLRAHLPGQGTQVQTPVRGIPHAKGQQACVPPLLSLHARACALQKETPPQ